MFWCICKKITFIIRLGVIMLFFRLLYIYIYIYIFVGLPSSINNSCALRELAFYNKAQCHNLFSPNEGVEGIPPFVIIVTLTKMCLWT